MYNNTPAQSALSTPCTRKYSVLYVFIAFCVIAHTAITAPRGADNVKTNTSAASNESAKEA